MRTPTFPTRLREPKGAESSPTVSARNPLNRLVRIDERDDASNPGHEDMHTPDLLLCQDTSMKI